MKKTISFITAVASLLACCNITAFAENTPTPANVDEAVYAQLMKHKFLYDLDSDGVITDAELAQTEYLSIDLDGISDLSWLKKLTSCNDLSFSNGNITDFSILKELPALKYMDMRNVPITDISFMKDLHLESCCLYEMDQITPEQRAEVLHFTAPEIWEGTAARIECQPRNLLDYDISIADKDTAAFLNGTTNASYVYDYIYGVSAGKTTYTISYGGKDLYTGDITVKKAPQAYDPALHDIGIDNFEVEYSHFYNYDAEDGRLGNVALLNGILYSIRGSEVKVLETEVADYEYFSKRTYNNDYNNADMVLKKDGTLLVNGEPVTDIKVKSMRNGYYLGENGNIYTLVPKGDGFITTTVATDSKGWIDGCEPFYVSDNGHIKYYSTRIIGDGRVNVYTGSTYIGEPSDVCCVGSNCYVINGRTLYEIRYSDTLTKNVIAKDVVSVRASDDGLYAEYTKADGTVEKIAGKNVYNTHPERALGIYNGVFYIHQYQYRGIREDDAVFNYFIQNDDKTMSLAFLGDWCGLTNVESEVCCTYDEAMGHGFVYFLRTDGSIWKYDLDAKQWQEAVAGTSPIVIPQEDQPVRGDVNADGKFNIADAVLLRQWLNSSYDAFIPNIKAGDLCEDNRLDEADLEIMEKELIKAR